MWTIDLPLRVPVSKSSTFSINLNQYRNAHFQVLDKAKKKFTQIAVEAIKQVGIPKLSKITLEYTLYPPTRQLCDVNNVCSIADKFFSDSLVESGVLEDDNYLFIADSRFLFGHVDRENPRVTVVVRDHTHQQQEGNKPMKIQTIINLTQDDVNQALREFLAKSNFTVPTETNIYLEDDEDGYTLKFVPELGAQPETAKKTRKARAEPGPAVAALNAEAAAKKEEAVPQIDHSDKTPAEKHLDSVKGTPEEAEARAKVEAERQAKATTPVTTESQPSTETPPPATTPSLFGSFVRPKN